MAANKIDSRQITYRGLLDQIATLNPQELDNLLLSLNNQTTPLLRMKANTASLVVNVGGGDLTDSETNFRKAIPHVGTAYIQFSSGTLTFPAASGGNIVASPGNNSVLTVASGNFNAVLVYLDGSGNLNTIPGTDSAVLNTAITSLPPAPDSTLPLGFIVVQNVAGVIQNIVQSRIAQFGTGAGGGGTGDASLTDVALRDRFAQSGFKYLDPNIFKRDKTTKVELAGPVGPSTGVFDLVKSAFKFTSIGNTFISTNLANAEFLAEGVDITEVELYVHWLLGFIDNAATYQVSRDGGTNYTTLTMARVGTTGNAYRGYQTFSDEVTQQNLQVVAASGAGTVLNATTTQQLSSPLVLASTTAVRSIVLELSRTAALSVGNFKVSIVKDLAGVPSTLVTDIYAESNLVSIAGLSTGNLSVTVALPTTVLVAGTYQIVLSTDATYRAGVLDVFWRSAAAGTTGASYNGTVWAGSASTKASTVKGRVHDLRIKITAGTALTYLEGMGVYFGVDEGITAPNGTKNVQRFLFTGDENKTVFTLNWTPDPDLIEFYDVYRGQVYVIDNDTVRLSGQTVTFDSGTFSFPGESILLIARQIKGIGIDNSDSNAAAISAHSTNLIDVGNQISELEFVTIPKIAVPNTTIVNRAQIPDLSQDLNARFGIERIMTQSVYQLQNEFGANGEPVWATPNDRLGQIRFVGSWQSGLSSNGSRAQSVVLNDYLEITFYGTGLNILSWQDVANYDYRPTVDGGVESGNIFAAVTFSGILGQRGYAENCVASVVSNLTLGIHTVKIRNNSPSSLPLTVFGFEILNTSSTIKVNPGSQYVAGKKLTLASQQSLVHNTTFETGTLGTKGGRVLVYQKSDATIAKAVIPTDASQLSLSSTSHSNEEVARTHHWREFGAGRTDDFSRIAEAAASSNYAFTLDDGTTTLVGSAVLPPALVSGAIGFNAAGSFLTLTFVGTGLDIMAFKPSGGGVFTVAVSIDGATSVGNIANTDFANAAASTKIKVCSGLSYGTHTVKFTVTGTFSLNIGITQFIVYQPKTPTLPVGAKAINAYNLMADFVANTSPGAEFLSTGILRKAAAREMVYVGTWAVGLTVGAGTAGAVAGVRATSSALNDNVSYTFYGTGIDLRISTAAVSSNATVTVDGTNPTAAGATATSFYGTGITSFAAGTGLVSFNGTGLFGAGVRISGLSLGLHTVKINLNSTNGIGFESCDIITPIHSPKSNLYADLQNTLAVGSQGVEDLRKIAPLEQVTSQKAWAQAVGVANSPTTTSTVAVPMPDMSVTIKTNGGSLIVSAFARCNLSTAIGSSSAAMTIFIDGVRVGAFIQHDSLGASLNFVLSNTAIAPVSAGFHKVDIYWLISSGTVTAQQTDRILVVEEK